MKEQCHWCLIHRHLCYLHSLQLHWYSQNYLSFLAKRRGVYCLKNTNNNGNDHFSLLNLKRKHMVRINGIIRAKGLHLVLQLQVKLQMHNYNRLQVVSIKRDPVKFYQISFELARKWIAAAPITVLLCIQWQVEAHNVNSIHRPASRHRSRVTIEH